MINFTARVLVLALGAHAVTFRVTQEKLVAPRSGLCSASWGNATLFTGGSSGNLTALDVFVDGVHVAASQFEAPNSFGCSATGAFPGVIMVSTGVTGNTPVQFFDVATRTPLPFNNSLVLSGTPYRYGSVGSHNVPLAGVVVSDGKFDLIDTSTRHVLRTLDPNQGSAGVARLEDSNGREYFVIAGGSPVGNKISVLPTDSSGTFVNAPSFLTGVRLGGRCTATSTNVMVCTLGNNATGNAVDYADVCAINTTGVVSCVAKSLDTYFEPVAVESFVLGIIDQREVSFLTYEYYISAIDPTLSTLRTTTIDGPLDQRMWVSGYTSVGAGRFAYLAGGSGISTIHDTVKVIECISPCAPPLASPTTTLTTTTTNSAFSSGESSDADKSVGFHTGALVFFVLALMLI